MSGWGIFAIVLIVLFLIGQILVGVDVCYGEDGPLVKVRLGWIRIKVFPFPAKDKKAKKKQEIEKVDASKSGTQPVPDRVEPVSEVKAASKPTDQTVRHAPEAHSSKRAAKKPDEKAAVQLNQTPDITTEGKPNKKAGKKLSLEQILYLAQEFVPLILEAVSTLWSKLVMDELELSVTVGSSDPADTAMLYGRIHGAMGAIWQPLTTAFHVKNGRAHIDVDFQAQSITLYAHAALSIKIGQIGRIVLYFGIRALKKFLKFQNAQKATQQQRKAV